MIDNTHMSEFIPPSAIQKSAGTWAASVASNVAKDARAQADAAFTLMVPIPLPQNANVHNGARLKSLDVYYKIAVAADDFATVELEKITLPSDGSAPAGAAVTTTCDSGHDSAAKRKAAADHVMTVTPSADLWMANGAVYVLQMVVDCAATTDFTLYGARANYELRLD